LDLGRRSPDRELGVGDREVTVEDPRAVSDARRILPVSSLSHVDTGRLKLTGELDAHSAPEIRERLHALIDESPTLVVVDLERVTFLDSTILGVLVGGLRRMREGGGELQLVFPHQPARRIFEFTGLERVFPAAD
jgi:anti-sigma B factor antagonist